MANYNAIKYVGFSKGSTTLIKTLTADGSAGTLTFQDGSSDVVLDNTYKEYLFTFKNIHPQNDNGMFSFNLSADGGSNYNVTKTSTFFNTYNAEGGSNNSLNYVAGSDLAQGTGFQRLFGIGGDNDQNSCGILHLFDPSNTTFVKHFIFVGNDCDPGDFSTNRFVAGYANTTSAINAIQFKFASGNIDAGTFKLYGVV